MPVLPFSKHSREEFVDLVSRQNLLDDEKVAERPRAFVRQLGEQ
jgi:hypothetical protein